MKPGTVVKGSIGLFIVLTIVSYLLYVPPPSKVYWVFTAPFGGYLTMLNDGTVMLTNMNKDQALRMLATKLMEVQLNYYRAEELLQHMNPPQPNVSSEHRSHVVLIGRHRDAEDCGYTGLGIGGGQ